MHQVVSLRTFCEQMNPVTLKSESGDIKISRSTIQDDWSRAMMILQAAAWDHLLLLLANDFLFFWHELSCFILIRFLHFNSIDL